MDLELAGMRVLVTGSSSGLGEAIALEFAAEGAAVVVHGRDAIRTEAVARQVRALGAQAATAIGDLASEEGAAAVAASALSAFGGIDILVNNAGAVLRMDEPDWLKVGSEDWFASYDLNVMAAVRMTKLLSGAMAERGWGRIINVSSVSGTVMRGRLMDYGAAKAALNSVTVNMSKVLSPRGVTVNSVIPGTVITPAIERWIATVAEQNQWPGDAVEHERRYVERTGQSLPRLGRPREIAAAVAFLASPLSGYTTGAFLRIEGGLSGATAV